MFGHILLLINFVSSAWYIWHQLLLPKSWKCGSLCVAEYINDQKYNAERGGRPSRTVNHYSQLVFTSVREMLLADADEMMMWSRARTTANLPVSVCILKRLDFQTDRPWGIKDNASRMDLEGRAHVCVCVYVCNKEIWMVLSTVHLSCYFRLLDSDLSAGPSDLTGKTAFEKLYNHSCGDMRSSCTFVLVSVLCFHRHASHPVSFTLRLSDLWPWRLKTCLSPSPLWVQRWMSAHTLRVRSSGACRRLATIQE